MTFEEAKAILAEPLPSRGALSSRDNNRIIKGLLLLCRVDPEFNSDLEFHAEHDQIFVADFTKTVAIMSVDDVMQMHTWGWFESEDSWSHFT